MSNTGKDALHKLDQGLNSTADLLGWIDIERSNLPYEGKLYPASWVFKIKPATVAEIRHYSSLDETNAQSILDAIYQMLKMNLKVMSGSQLITYENLYEHDKFFFILYIQSISNTGKELQFDHVCPKCQTKQSVSLTQFSLSFTELSEKADSYLADGKFHIKTKSFGEIDMTPLTLSDFKKIAAYTKDQRAAGVKVEAAFTKIAPFLKTENYKASEMYQTYLGLSKEKFNLFLNMYNRYFDIRALETLQGECDECKCGIQPQIQFPGGIANLFANDNVDDELI